jgi:hypothetical protein
VGEIKGKSGHYCNYDDILKELSNDGVKPEDLDTGWNGPEGPEGAQDGDIHARELVAYLYENWETYQGLIEKETSFKVPWTLDDGNPHTKFDLKIREHVESLIAKAHQDISDESLAPGMTAYRKAFAKRIFELVLESPVLSGTPPFVNYRMIQGSHPLSLLIDAKEELSALDHLSTGDGSCTEKTKVLFAIYSMAGFDCRAVDVQVDEYGLPISHLALQVKVDTDTWITADTSMKSFDPAYKFVNPLSNAEFAAIHYDSLNTTSNSKKAAFINPSMLSFDVAIQYALDGKLSEAEDVLRRMHPCADDIRPEIYMLQMLKNLEHPSYKTYVEKYKKAKPDIFIKHILMISSSIMHNSLNFDVDLLKDLAPTKESAEFLTNLDLFKAINQTDFDADDENMTELLKSNDADDQYAIAVTGHINSGKLDSAYDISKTWMEERPGNDLAKKAFISSCYHLGKYEEMIDVGEKLFSAGELTPEYGYGMALAYARVNGSEKAIDFLDAYMEKTPISYHTSEYQHTRIMLYIANGDAGAAKELIGNLPAGDPFAGFYKASLKLISGDTSGADADMVDILRDEPGQYWLDIYLRVANFMPCHQTSIRGSQISTTSGASSCRS